MAQGTKQVKALQRGDEILRHSKHVNQDVRCIVRDVNVSEHWTTIQLYAPAFGTTTRHTFANHYFVRVAEPVVATLNRISESLEVAV